MKNVAFVGPWDDLESPDLSKDANISDWGEEGIAEVRVVVVER